MASIALHHPYGNDFDRFLYACVGEDEKGNVVTVLSTFSRLGLEPWQEASELGALSRDGAITRLSSVLAEFPGVPALRNDHDAVAQELIKLLPERSTPLVSKLVGSSGSETPSVSIGTVFAVATILMVLVRIFVIGGPGQ